MDSLQVALTAFLVFRTPVRITNALRSGGREGIVAEYQNLPEQDQVDIRVKARELAAKGVDAMLWRDDDFPQSLVHETRPLMPILFYMGNKELFYRDGVGMCGSRNVSMKGLEAADRCGVAASSRDWTIVSGYAKGVDTATHLAALRSGGNTVIVLAEGIDFWRVKRDFAHDYDPDRALVVSQFGPTQTWQAHAAMARNSVIFGLSKALVVIEAGERGGTLAAGEGALKLGRPVLVVDFADETPPGNVKLLEQGAHPIRSAGALKAALDWVASAVPEADDQVPLF
ncbi:DNA-processing protein DprA [Curtobacterium sp. NPDC089991]|uniref:DNA-processing protein DprA n=1 Tax=Curtobacterium sp. NPDC089991 TaxID=3363969 RepID=UPI0037F2C3A9